MQRRVARGAGQSQQQSRDELRRDRSVDGHLAAVHRAAHLEGEVSAVLLHLYAQLPQRRDHHPHRAAQQRPLALDAHGFRAERRDGCKQARRQTRFADGQPPSDRVQPALDRERGIARRADAGTERADAPQRRARVVAESEVVQRGDAVAKQRRRQGALCVAFGTGGRQGACNAAWGDAPIHSRGLCGSSSPA